jgi:hypothetical protein
LLKIEDDDVELLEELEKRKNLLEKLILKCPYKCNNEEEFNYETLIKHLSICDKMKVNCPCCDSFVPMHQIKEPDETQNLKLEIE